MPHITTTNMVRLLGTLPQELYDEIYNLTFAIDDDALIITKTWRPPHLPRVDRTSRAQYARSYFGSSLGINLAFGDSLVEYGNCTVALLSSLDVQHIAHIQSIHNVFSQELRKELRMALGMSTTQVESNLRDGIEGMLKLKAEEEGNVVQQAVFDLAARLELPDEKA